MGSSLLVWVVVAVVVLIVIIVIAVIVARGKSQVRNRERAAELRTRAGQDSELLDSRRERAEDLESQADAARQRAMTESDKADSLRAQAGELDEVAARASEKAEILGDEATHSREAFDEAVEERDEALREADRRDPDVHTDRHGNRTDDVKDDDNVPEGVIVFPAVDEDEVVVPENDEETIVTAEPDEEVVEVPEDAEEVLVIPDEERLDIGDDYSGDEFAEPDAEYIDPVEHDRMDRVRDDVPVADTPVLDESEDDVIAGGATALVPHTEPELISPAPARRMQESPSDEILGTADVEDLSTPDPVIVDPYGSTVGVTDTSSSIAGAPEAEDDLPRDDQGRRLDPYGNPVVEDQPIVPDSTPTDDDLPRDDQGRRLDSYGNTVVEDEQFVPDTTPYDDDVPRDEQGRRLDPYGNPVAEDLDPK